LPRRLGSLQTEDVDWVVGPESLVAWLLALIAVVVSVFVEGRRLFGSTSSQLDSLIIPSQAR
jgi:hypothetical protein